MVGMMNIELMMTAASGSFFSSVLEGGHGHFVNINKYSFLRAEGHIEPAGSSCQIQIFKKVRHVNDPNSSRTSRLLDSLRVTKEPIWSIVSLRHKEKENNNYLLKITVQLKRYLQQNRRERIFGASSSSLSWLLVRGEGLVAVVPLFTVTTSTSSVVYRP